MLLENWTIMYETFLLTFLACANVVIDCEWKYCQSDQFDARFNYRKAFCTGGNEMVLVLWDSFGPFDFDSNVVAIQSKTAGSGGSSSVQVFLHSNMK